MIWGCFILQKDVFHLRLVYGLSHHHLDVCVDIYNHVLIYGVILYYTSHIYEIHDYHTQIRCLI